jgi:hypothetical protein
MDHEGATATQPISGTSRHAVPSAGTVVPPETGPDTETDPLAKITMRPQTFAAALAIAAFLLGLLLALIPVHVAGPDVAAPRSITCGNTIGGVETASLGEGLGDAATPELVSTYVGSCETAMGFRLVFAWPLFFAGGLAVLWSLVVRRTPRTETVAAAQLLRSPVSPD